MSLDLLIDFQNSLCRLKHELCGKITLMGAPESVETAQALLEADFTFFFQLWLKWLDASSVDTNQNSVLLAAYEKFHHSLNELNQVMSKEKQYHFIEKYNVQFRQAFEEGITNLEVKFNQIKDISNIPDRNKCYYLIEYYFVECVFAMIRAINPPVQADFKDDCSAVLREICQFLGIVCEFKMIHLPKFTDQRKAVCQSAFFRVENNRGIFKFDIKHTFPNDQKRTISSDIITNMRNSARDAIDQQLEQVDLRTQRPEISSTARGCVLS